jgi:hypothetical protein
MNIARTLGGILLGGFLTLGCTLTGSDGEPFAGEVDGEGDDGEGYDNDDCKIEGGDIGEDGVQVLLGSRTVTFDSWAPKVGEAGEYVGFSISVSGADSVGYEVKTGGELHASSDTTWAHPNGDEGSEVPGISYVDFCEECEDGGCEGGDGDGDDGEDGDDGDDGGDGGGDCEIDEDCDGDDVCNNGQCGPIIVD